jgi:neutral ceramidase
MTKRGVVMVVSCVLALVGSVGLSRPSAQAPTPGALRAGAAKVEIAADPSPRYEHLRLYVRAIVIDNGTTRGALVGADISNLSGGVWEEASKRIAAELGSPIEHIIVSATHTHSGAGRAPNGQAAPTNAGVISDAMLQAVRQARAQLQPARVGYGTGLSYLNVNRDAINPTTHLWTQAANLAAPSDKTVGVLKFETISGQPIGVYVNYAMHPVNGYLSGLVSGDYAGAMSRYVELAYNDRMIAVFTQGASGDQNPLHLRASTDVMASRADVPITGYELVREDVESRIRGVASAPPAADPKVVDRLSRWMDVQGAMLGEEVIRVMTETARTSTTARLWGAQRVVSCPGRDRTDTGREGVAGTYKDGAPAEIRIGAFGIGDIALATVGAEIYNVIGQRIRRQSPLANTMVVTIANGRANSGYVPDDASFGRYTFQVLGSRLKPGCAEDAIANGLTEILSQSLRH